MDRTTTRYFAAWASAAVVALAIVLLSSDLAAFELSTFVTLIVIIAAAEFVVVHIDLGRAGAIFTLSEAAITAGLLLVPPIHVVAAASVAMLIALVPRRLTAEKVLFNVSQLTTATCAAALVVLATPDLGPVVGDRAPTTVVLGMAAYAVVNTLAFRGLVSRVAGLEGVADFDEQAPLTLASLFGTVAVGIVAAALWGTQPWLIPLLLVPVIAIQLAGRSSLAKASLVGTLRAERDRLEQVVLGASDGILLLDAEATIRVWSPALEELTGIASADAIGHPVAQLLTPARRLTERPVEGRWLIDVADPDRRRHRFQVRWRAADGNLRDVQEDHALLFDDRLHCTGDVVVLRDVTREAELERLRADFVARISHELRSPLTPIRGFVQLLLRRGDRLTDDQQHEALTSVLDRTDRLREVIEDLLLVTQVERGQLDGVVNASATPVGEILVKVVDEATAREPHRMIDLTLDPTVPDAWADSPRLRQAVGALIDNALRYSSVDDPVTVTLQGDAQQVTIRVLDHGPGIPTSQRARIFEQFERLEDPMTMRTGGVGLGLFIARRVTEAMGGRLELERSERGHTVFALHLRTTATHQPVPPQAKTDEVRGS